MSWEIPVLDISVPANADLSAAQYLAVQINTSGKAALSDATVRNAGILQNDPDAADKAASVRVLGVSKAYASGTVAIMDALAPGTDGVLLTTTADNDEIVAFALEAHTGATSSVISVFVCPFNRY